MRIPATTSPSWHTGHGQRCRPESSSAACLLCLDSCNTLVEKFMTVVVLVLAPSLHRNHCPPIVRTKRDPVVESAVEILGVDHFTSQKFGHKGEYVTPSGFDMVPLEADSGTQELNTWWRDILRSERTEDQSLEMGSMLVCFVGASKVHSTFHADTEGNRLHRMETWGKTPKLPKKVESRVLFITDQELTRNLSLEKLEISRQHLGHLRATQHKKQGRLLVRCATSITDYRSAFICDWLASVRPHDMPPPGGAANAHLKGAEDLRARDEKMQAA